MTFHAPVLGLASGFGLSFLLLTGWEDDYFKAQQCFNKTPSIACLQPILPHDNVPVNRLKCAIRVFDQGIHNYLFDFPHFYDAPGRVFWPVFLSALSTREIQAQEARHIRYDCQRVSEDKGDLLFKILGEHYWLLYRIGELTQTDNPALHASLSALRDGESMREIGDAIERIIHFCSQYSANAPARRMSVCKEPLRVPSYHGSTTFDKYVMSTGSFGVKYGSSQIASLSLSTAGDDVLDTDICARLAERDLSVVAGDKIGGLLTCLDEIAALAGEPTGLSGSGDKGSWRIDLPVGVATTRITLFDDSIPRDFKICRSGGPASDSSAFLSVYLSKGPTMRVGERACVTGRSSRVRLRAFKGVQSSPNPTVLSGHWVVTH